MPLLKSPTHTKSLKELYDKINVLPASELKYYLFLLLDAIKNSKASQREDILQETFCFCDTVSNYLANKSSSDEKYVRALHGSLEKLIETTALNSYANKVEKGFVTVLGLCCGLLFSAVLGCASAIRGLFIRPNIFKGALEGFTIGFGLGMILGTRLPEKWIIREDKRKLTTAINGLADSLQVFTSNKSSSFEERVEKHTNKIKGLFSEQNPTLSQEGLDKAFNDFLTTHSNQIEICSRPIHLFSEHSEGFMGHHSYIKFKLFGEKHVLELANPNTEFEATPSQKEIRKITGQQLIEMIAFNDKLSETHILNNLSYMMQKYKAGEADCVTHLDKLLTVTSQSPSNIRRVNEQSDNSYSAYLIGKGFEYLSAFAHHDVLSTHQEFNGGYIKTSPYVPEPQSKAFAQRPLIIASSGGGGHISAANGIIDYLRKSYKKIDITAHHPKAPPKEAQPSYEKLKMAMSWMHEKSISGVLKHIIKNYTYYPVLPEREELEKEVELLKSKNAPDTPRPYIDMLLDVCDIGYESAAIYNSLMKKEDISSLKKLVEYQKEGEEINHQRIYDFFLTKLKSAAKERKPYSELISTQVLGFKPLCDAIIDYNKWLDSNEQLQHYPRPIIHQYMTDMPTDGAQHFYNGLKALNTQQRSHMKLYGCELDFDFLIKNLPLSNSFAGLHRIDAKNNPMVRAGFSNVVSSLHDKWDIDNDINYSYFDDVKKQNKVESVQVKANEKVAAIMLGSQGSIDTIKYVKALIQSDHDKIFVFGGMNKSLHAPLKKIMKLYPTLQHKIICLANQDDKVIQPIMTRSHTIVTGGGGLSLMEQLAMPHNPNQKIHIHHPDSNNDELTSGLSWQDENESFTIKHSKLDGYKVIKTNPKLFAEDIKAETELSKFYSKAKTEKFNYTMFSNMPNRESLPMNTTTFTTVLSI